jgi:antitoxin VapB
MALHIKNPRVETLARELSALTGESLTVAIQRALEERLERLIGPTCEPDVVETLLEIGRRCSALPDLDSHHRDEILGDDEAGACRRPAVHKD